MPSFGVADADAVPGAVAELEAQIAAAPDSVDAYAVLGDLLAQAGDPRGELIALQLAAQAAPDKHVRAAAKLRAAADAHLAKHARALLGPLAPHAAALRWRSGFVRRIESGDAALVVQALQHPSGRFVVELALDLPQPGAAEPLLAHLVASPPRALRELELVARGRAVDLAPMLARLPWLERVTVTAPSIELGDGALQLPGLRRLRLSAATLTATCMHAIVAAAMPALERLELRFGTRDDAPATFADVRPLLARRDLPALTHLRLRNAPFAGGIVRELLVAPLAAQLAVVDLSHGSMSPADAAALIANPAPLAHVKELWLPMRLLRAVDRGALAALGKHVIDDVRAGRDDTDALVGG